MTGPLRRGRAAVTPSMLHVQCRPATNMIAWPELLVNQN
jgi:hypothetical protein